MNITTFSFTSLCANPVDDNLIVFFLFSPEDKLWYFMQIVS